MNIVKTDHPDYIELFSAFHNAASPSPLLSLLDIDYKRAYFHDSRFENASFLIEEKGQPVLAVVAAFRHASSGGIEFSGFGRPLLYIENCECDDVLLAKAKKLLSRELDELLNCRRPMTVIHHDFLKRNSLSPVSLYFLDNGASASPLYTQVLDLSKSKVDLKKQIRKSYKSLINWGRKHFQTQIIDGRSVTDAHIEEFRQLHIAAAGQETRSRQTWKMQQEQILANEAFLVSGYHDDQLISAALFIYNKLNCFYGVSASNREMFDKPLSHHILWTAILHAQSLRCRNFEMGEQMYPGKHSPAPTQKELGISKFKRGFGGDTLMRLNVRLS